MSKLFLLLTVVVLTGGVGLGVAVNQGAPAAHGLPEVGLGETGLDTGIVYLSGKRFDCAPLPDGASGAMRCTLPVEDSLLEIEVHPATVAPSRFEGSCVARYGGEEHACGEGLRRGAARSIAVIPDGLGLTEIQREALRARYAAENESDPFLPIYAYALLLAALVVGTLAFSGKKERTSVWRERASLVLPLGVVTFLLITGIGSWLTSYLWD